MPEHTQRLVKLISVRLKEAALDSPSFRASVNYINNQVDQTDQWIDGLSKFTKKYPQQFGDFEEFNNVLLNQLIPDFLAGGLIDQEATITVLNKAKSNLEDAWSRALKELEFKNADAVKILSSLSKVHIKHYKDVKRNFEFLQGKYDSLLSKFMQGKGKEPSALREDAFQLFEVRKSYLSASLDLCLEVSKFHQVLDTSLIELTDVVFKGKSNYDSEFFSKVSAWSKAIAKSVNSLLQDMARSKEQIEQISIADFEPARDLRHYNTAMINPATLAKYDRNLDGDMEELYEKHGWLWMKTNVGKPSRQIWVRRWVFVKSGIWGLFSLSPSKHFVQETDKIGVLLCNIRYAPDEDRRFCFEIKTIDTTIVFQAETLKELRAWIRVFTVEKQHAINNAETETGKFAFGRYPPLLYEFASTSLTSLDVELTSSTYDNTTSEDMQFTIASSHLSELVSQMRKLGIDDGMPLISGFRGAFLSTPITTSRSKSALISHEFVRPTVIPTAITANIWGCVNWGLYYMNETEPRQRPRQSPELDFSTLSKGDQYPPTYSPTLKQRDVELKSLFDTKVGPSELVVLSFTCLWSLNPNQELSGRCFVTDKGIYFYLNSAGFVSLHRKFLINVVAVDVAAGDGHRWDVLKLYDIDGLDMKGRVFLEDAVLIQKKLDLLINNLSKQHPSSVQEILFQIETLEKDYFNSKTVSVLPTLQPPFDEETSHHTAESRTLRFIQGKEAFAARPVRSNYLLEYPTLTTHSFGIPAKALFHMMFGDESGILRDTFSYFEVDEFKTSPWYAHGQSEGEKPDGVLSRYIDFKASLKAKLGSLREGEVSSRIEQTIEEMVENRYYRVAEVRNSFRFPWGGAFRVKRKIVILAQDNKTSKLYLYANLSSSNSEGHTGHGLGYDIFKNTILHFQLGEMKTCVEKLSAMSNELGTHGKIIRAIRQYGNLSVAEGDFEKREDFVMNLRYTVIIRYYLSVVLYEVISSSFTLLRFFLITVLHVWRGLYANRVLLTLLLLSILGNLFLIGKTSVSFWHAVRTENLLWKFRGEAQHNQLDRSISLNEMDLLASTDFNTTSRALANYLNSEVANKDAAAINSKFRDSKHSIALKRNELLVELKILEKVEKELTIGGYRNFLLSEMNSCKVAFEQLQIEDSSLQEYCYECTEEWERITSSLL